MGNIIWFCEFDVYRKASGRWLWYVQCSISILRLLLLLL